MEPQHYLGLLSNQKSSFLQFDQLEKLFEPCQQTKGLFFQFYDIYKSDCDKLNINADTRQMFGQLMNLKFPTYHLKSTTSKDSLGVKIISGVKPITIDLLQFRELGLEKHFNEWISSQCQVNKNATDWGILLKLNFQEYSRNKFFEGERSNSIRRNLLALPGVTKERVKRINTPQYILQLHESPPQTVSKYRGVKRKHTDGHDIALEQDNHSVHSLQYSLFVNPIN